MLKILNIFFFILILSFYLNVYKFYSSNKNIKIKDFTRNNIHQIINDKISNLPVLPNDTNNIIEFNDSFSNEINTTKPRSFWNLLKSK
tara:strand:+ start:1902 stop:2165 length:264 start_codon:yes stop_codon:yes gene_type:complete